MVRAIPDYLYGFVPVGPKPQLDPPGNEPVAVYARGLIRLMQTAATHAEFEDAYTKLFWLYASHVNNYIAPRVDSKEDRWDVFADVWAKAFSEIRNKPSLCIQSVLGWLYSIVRSERIEHLEQHYGHVKNRKKNGKDNYTPDKAKLFTDLGLECAPDKIQERSFAYAIPATELDDLRTELVPFMAPDMCGVLLDLTFSNKTLTGIAAERRRNYKTFYSQYRKTIDDIKAEHNRKSFRKAADWYDHERVLWFPPEAFQAERESVIGIYLPENTELLRAKTEEVAYSKSVIARQKARKGKQPEPPLAPVPVPAKVVPRARPVRLIDPQHAVKPTKRFMKAYHRVESPPMPYRSTRYWGVITSRLHGPVPTLA